MKPIRKCALFQSETYRRDGRIWEIIMWKKLSTRWKLSKVCYYQRKRDTFILILWAFLGLEKSLQANGKPNVLFNRCFHVKGYLNGTSVPYFECHCTDYTKTNQCKTNNLYCQISNLWWIFTTLNSIHLRKRFFIFYCFLIDCNLTMLWMNMENTLDCLWGELVWFLHKDMIYTRS